MTAHTSAWLGQILLLVVLLGTVYAGGSAWLSTRLRSSAWLASARYTTYVCAALLTLVSLLVWFALLSNDFSIKYVFKNSEIDMPWIYKLTAYWGGLDGSLLFWAWILSGCAALAVHWNHRRHPDLIPWVIVILMGLLCFFVGLVVFFKPPFAVFLTQTPIQGQGLNPALQDPYMAIHPPSLYVGYITASIPFAFGMAALITGRLDDTWLTSVRRWMLVCWYFLSQGLILGSLWAYHVLGWGGYWGWDPVENAGLFPWLTATAFLHSILIQERRGLLKSWNVVLVLLTFLLTLVGTMLTRSGIVQSVHAFGKDPAMAGMFLGLIGVCALLGFGLIRYRRRQLQPRGEIESFVSREFFFLLNNWVLLGTAVFVLVLTLFPTLTEAVRGERITVGPEAYRRWMPLFGLLLLGLMALAPLVPWRRSAWSQLWRHVRWPLLFSGVVTAVLAVAVPITRTRSLFLHTQWKLPISLICIALVCAALAGVVQEFVQGIRARRQMHGAESHGQTVLQLVLRNKRRYGGYVIHVGVALMFFAFAGEPFQVDHDVNLGVGQSVQVASYTLTFESASQTQDSTRERMQQARLHAWRGTTDLGVLLPARWTYRKHTDEPPRTVIHIRSNVQEDLYVVLTGLDTQAQQASFKICVNRLVFWLWCGFALLLFGTVIVVLPDGAGKHTALAVLLVGGLLMPAAAHAQETPLHGPMAETHLPQPPRNDTEQQLRKKLVCLCGCGRQTLAECTCGQAAQERERIALLMDQGKTPDEILATFVKDHQTEAVLSVPPNRGGYKLMWLVPLLGFAGVGVALWLRMRRRARTRPHATPAPDTALDAYKTRLDAELAEEDA